MLEKNAHWNFARQKGNTVDIASDHKTISQNTLISPKKFLHTQKLFIDEKKSNGFGVYVFSDYISMENESKLELPAELEIWCLLQKR